MSPQAVDKIFAELADPKSPGCAVGVSRNGRLILSRSYGSANLEHDAPINAASNFGAGSVSKQFTAAAILILAEEGKLSLSDDVRRYVPELPDYGHRITIAHLLNHTSGLRDWGDMSQISGWRLGTRVFSNADAIQFLARQRSLNFRPGDDFEYTASGYVLAAEIVERVSGKTFAEFTKERIFKPLAMTNSSWSTDFREIVKGRASAYARKAGGVPILYMPFSNVLGPSGLLTTVGDLLTWNRALDEGRLGAFVTAELQREGQDNRGRPLGYARGLFVERRHGQREVSHGGLIGGYQSTLLRYPDHKLSVALLCNALHITSTDYGHQLAGLYLPKAVKPAPSAPPASPAALDPAQAARFAGVFVDEASSQMVNVAASGGALKWNDTALQATGPTRFRRENGGDVEFTSPDLVELTREDGSKSSFVRVAGPVTDAAELASFAGHYRSDELLTSFDVTVVEGKLRFTNPQTRFSFDVRPVGGDIFHAPGALVRFYRDDSGRGKSFRLGIRRARIEFTRSGI